jgi:Bacterial regulatory proteins, tetR family
MPCAPEHKEQTHARIVDCARRMFNRHGFEAVSIDQIMASAGLTRGGFYHEAIKPDALHMIRPSEAPRARTRRDGAASSGSPPRTAPSV